MKIQLVLFGHSISNGEPVKFSEEHWGINSASTPKTIKSLFFSQPNDPNRPLLFLSIFAVFCNYQPEGEFIKDLEMSSLNSITLDLNYYLDAEIQLAQPTTFTYTINTNGKRWLDESVFLDNIVFSSSAQPLSSFLLDAETPQPDHILFASK